MLFDLWLAPFVLYTFYFCNAAEMEEVFSWKRVQYKWPDKETENLATSTGAYIPENNVPLGIARWENRIFITLNRWKKGVASTLNYIEIGNDKSPLLIPYPSWESNLIWNHSNKDPSKQPIVSVFRVWVDSCNRLWAVDDGVDDFFGDQRKIIGKSILIFDLTSDKLLRRYFFPESDFHHGSAFGNIVVDIASSSCEDAHAYISDFAGFGLVVYKYKSNTSWRIRHLYFMPDPLSGAFNIGGVTAHWIDGVLGLALSDLHNDGFRTLYFHSLTSTTQFKVSTKVLQNQTWASTEAAFDEYKILGNRGFASQSTTDSFDTNTGVIFHTQVNRNGISCWDTTRELNWTSFLVAENEELLEFPADIKIDNERNIWVISNRLTKYLYGSHNKDEVNIRILKLQVDKAIENSNCK